MKRYGNLYESTISLGVLYDAYLTARKGKRNRRGVLEFERNLGYNLDKLHCELTDGTYTPKPYFHFKVYEPKERLISAPDFRDVVVQHAVYSVIRPIFDRSFIHESHGCRKGKGIHSASDSLQRMLRAAPTQAYTLQLDIRKFYYSIDHAILKSLLIKKIKDHQLINLMLKFVSDNGSTIGLPIGNLLSQLYALIYLNELDHFIKRELKVKNYLRYVDDFVLVGLTKSDCYANKSKIVEFLNKTLKLTLSHWTVAKIVRGCNFVGYRTWRTRKFIRKHSLYNFNRNLKKRNFAAIVSLLGHAKRTSSYTTLLEKYNAVLQISKNH